jgi:hypothetical protein
MIDARDFCLSLCSRCAISNNCSSDLACSVYFQDGYFPHRRRCEFRSVGHVGNRQVTSTLVSYIGSRLMNMEYGVDLG